MDKQQYAVAIGASLGGVDALMQIAARLPARFPAIVLVTQHIGSHASILPELMRSRGPNPALHPRDGELPIPGTIYLAPPDRHLLVERGCLRLVCGPKVNHSRPAIDPMFRSVALAFGPRAIGIVLSGRLDDGTAGLRTIKECGGVAIVQEPATAMAPGMPSSALANVAVDHCLRVEEMVPVILERLAACGEQGTRSA